MSVDRDRRIKVPEDEVARLKREMAALMTFVKFKGEVLDRYKYEEAVDYLARTGSGKLLNAYLTGKICLEKREKD